MAKRLTCLHAQQWRGDIPEMARALRSPWVKIMDPSGGNDPLPECKKVIRFWTDQWDRPLMAKGAAGATEYMNAVRPRMEAVRHWRGVHFETPNEPNPNVDEVQDAYVAFHLACIQIAASWDVKLVVGNWPEGNPGGSEGERIRRVLKWKPVVQACIDAGMYWSQHGYYKPGVCNQRDLWHANAHYRNGQLWAEHGVAMGSLQWMMTEYGLDGLISGGSEQGHFGWQWYVGRGRLTRSDYIGCLADWERWLLEQKWVPEAIFLYNIGSHSPWETYDHNTGVILELAQALPTLQEGAMGDPDLIALIAAAQAHVVPRTPGHALYEAGKAEGYHEAGDEFSFDGHVAQVFREPSQPRLQHIAFCRVGDWGNIRWVTVDNETHEIVA